MLRIHVLGPMQVEIDGKPLRGFESIKAMALFGYLAVQDRPVARAHLMGLFWGNKPAALAQGNLRRVLHNLSSLFPQYLHVDRQVVQLRCSEAAPCWLDAAAFSDLVARGDEDSLREAVALYRGEFMEGLGLDDCPEFEMWLLVERETRRQQVMHALRELAVRHAKRLDYQGGMRFAARLLALEPWCEEAHQLMMLLLARSGRRSAALRQYELCRRALADELGVEPSAETQALYRRLRALSTIPRRELPPQPTPFVGREAELAQIANLLTSDCRWLTILGMGGSGKTRLAIQAASQLAPAFLEGVYFVPLSSVHSTTGLLTALADALGLLLRDRGAPKEQIWNYLREKEVLLVMDNMEHLSDRAEVLAELLGVAPQLKIVATSRHPMRIRWERRLEIEGLAYPPPEAESPEAYSAVQLFVQNARRVRPDFALDDGNRDCVARLCRTLEGLPLAIEMAAAWIDRLSCQEIASRIARGLDALTAADRDLPPRHRSLRAVCDVSWNLLSQDEQQAFRRLSVFRGGFTICAAGEVAGASPSLLAALADKSMLRRVSSDRYDMHGLLHRYAKWQLARRPEEEARIKDAHAGYYARLVRRAEMGDAGRGSLIEIADEVSNVRAAWEWAVARRRFDLIGDMLEGLYRFYDRRGGILEGYALFERTVALLGDAGEDGGDGSRVRHRLLIRQGMLAQQLGRTDQARELLERGLALSRSAGDRPEVALALHALSRVAYAQGEYSQALRRGRESLELARSLGDRAGIARALRILGITHEATGEYAEAQACYHECLHVLSDIGDLLGVARVHNNLGVIAYCLGEFERAREHYVKSLDIRRQIGDRRGIAIALVNLGNVAQQCGQHKEAREYYEESLSTFQDMSDLQGIAFVLNNLGNLARELGRYQEAEQFLQDSLAIKRKLGDRRGMANSLNNLGYLALARGHKAAERTFRRALKLATQIGSLPLVLESLGGIAASWAMGGCRERALELAATILGHPATPPEARERVQKIWDELTANVPAQTIAAAREVGERRSPEEVAAAILKAEDAGDDLGHALRKQPL